jgi:two-component system sensor histidine kinase KdpD
MMQSENRPDPDALLERLAGKEQAGKGRLKIFFGYAAGVGKTYAMLEEAREQYRNGVDVLVGYVEPHARPETLRLADGLPALEPKKISYRSIALREFDVDAALRRKPELVLVDELAHSNAEGLRNKKRYQDIEELLSAGIDVDTTLNVQHIESLNDVVQRITGITVQETVPDYIVDRADNVKLIDIDPEELLKRFGEGKVYRKERAAVARENFFTLGNLSSLREIAMRKAADRISATPLLMGRRQARRFSYVSGPLPLPQDAYAREHVWPRHGTRPGSSLPSCRMIGGRESGTMRPSRNAWAPGLYLSGAAILP